MQFIIIEVYPTRIRFLPDICFNGRVMVIILYPKMQLWHICSANSFRFCRVVVHLKFKAHLVGGDRSYASIQRISFRNPPVTEPSVVMGQTGRKGDQRGTCRYYSANTLDKKITMLSKYVILGI